jgi:hypothetical protein
MWSSFKANPGMSLEAQEILRWHNAPVASIKKRRDHWECSLLHVSGISADTHQLPISHTAEEIRLVCEELLVVMGWKKPATRGTPC